LLGFVVLWDNFFEMLFTHIIILLLKFNKIKPILIFNFVSHLHRLQHHHHLHPLHLYHLLSNSLQLIYIFSDTILRDVHILQTLGHQLKLINPLH